jgi:hypothetical protein
MNRIIDCELNVNFQLSVTMGSEELMTHKALEGKIYSTRHFNFSKSGVPNPVTCVGA